MKQLRNELVRAEDIDPLFMNRTDESLQLAQLLCVQKSTEEGVLPILSQHYGSGKTMLVMEFQNVIENRLRLSKEFDDVQKAVLVVLDLQRDFGLRSNDKLLSRVIRAMKEDFNYFKNVSKNIHSKDNNFEKSIKVLGNCYKCIIYRVPLTEVTKEMELDEQLLYKSLLSEMTFVSFFKAWSEANLWPVILFFDEYQCLADNNEDFEPLVNYWEQNLAPLIGKRENEMNASKVFTVIGGKLSNLTKLGRGLLVNEQGISISPTPAVHLVLDMLSLEHITTIMTSTVLIEQYTMKDMLFQFFSMSDESFQYFCNRVFVYTGGIPRIVKYVMTSLVRHVTSYDFKEIDLSNTVLIDQQFDRPALFGDVLYSCEMTFLAAKITKELEVVLLLGIIGIPIPFDLERDLMIDQIHELNVGIAKISENEIRLVIPYFTLFGHWIGQESPFYQKTKSLLKDKHHFNTVEDLALLGSIPKEKTFEVMLEWINSNLNCKDV